MFFKGLRRPSGSSSPLAAVRGSDFIAKSLPLCHHACMTEPTTAHDHIGTTFIRDPDLPWLEVRLSDYRRKAFNRHTHDTYSIACVLEGSTKFECSGQPAEAHAGELVLIRAGEPHACNPDTASGMRYLMFYVDQDWLETLAVENGLPVPVAFVSVVARDEETFAELKRLHELLDNGADTLEKESQAVHAFGGLLTRHATGVDLTAQEISRSVDAARRLLEERFAEKVGLDELSRRACLSKYHLLRVFKREMGLTPHEYQQQFRLNRAKELLLSGMSQAEAAAATGFADQSHFCKKFKAHAGVTPGEYRS